MKLPDLKQPAPSKAEIAVMEPFAGLTLERIHVPASHEEFAIAAAEIMAAGVVGFDTESKPTFAVGEVSDGPHLVQFALADKAYLFQLQHTAGHHFLLALLRSEQLIKAGFGLKSDGGHIQRKFGVKPGGLVDLNAVFHRAGYQREMGVRTAVALVFRQRFAKSRSTRSMGSDSFDPCVFSRLLNPHYGHEPPIISSIDLQFAERFSLKCSTQTNFFRLSAAILSSIICSAKHKSVRNLTNSSSDGCTLFR
ncbi:MAG TPA: hypothetical protein VIY48_20630 [Candidatus Paceibacterota bacterium]